MPRLIIYILAIAAWQSNNIIILTYMFQNTDIFTADHRNNAQQEIPSVWIAAAGSVCVCVLLCSNTRKVHW